MSKYEEVKNSLKYIGNNYQNVSKHCKSHLLKKTIEYNLIERYITQQPPFDKNVEEAINRVSRAMLIESDKDYDFIESINYKATDLVNDFNTIRQHILSQQQALNNKDAMIEKLKQELKEYKSISIGLDFGFKDNSAISIIQIFDDHLYQLYGKTFPAGSEISIRLDELIKSKKESDFVEYKQILLEEENDE